MKRNCLALILILMLLLFLAACGENALTEEISIDMDTVSEYYISSNNFNLRDIQITVKYTDGRSEPVKLTSDMISGYDPKAMGEQIITVTYKGKETTLKITVVQEEINVVYTAGAHGTIIGTLNQLVPYGEDAESVRAIPDNGYVFERWSDGVLNARRSDKNVKEDISVTANFTLASYNVRFYNRNGDLISSQQVISGGQPQVPQTGFEAEGFDFLGWIVKGEGSEADFSKITSNIDFIASYKSKQYEVFFYDLEGNITNALICDHGDSVIPPQAAELYGYQFSKWIIKGTENTAVFNNITSETRFEPRYIPVNFTITFNSQGGTALSPISVAYKATAGFLNIPSKTGMSFDGWFTAAEGGQRFDENSVVTGDITLYARWSVRECSVYFNTLGGSTIPKVNVLYNTKVSPPASPARQGHIFNGWYTTETGNVTYNYNNPVLSDITIYAHWTPLDYTVKFITNGGTAVSDKLVKYGTTITAPVSTREGFTLMGWSYYKDSDLLFDFGTPISGNTILYAIWQEQSVTVSASCTAGGSVNPEGVITIGYNKAVTVSIIPDAGYIIKKMTVNGNEVPASNEYSLNRTWHSLYVEFEILKYEITASLKSAGGKIEPLGKTSVEYGGCMTYDITPNEGYKIDLVRVNGMNLGATNTYTFTNIKSNQNIEAYFSKIKYEVTSTATTGGVINSQGTIYIEHGTDKTYLITPSSNYHILSVKINGVPQQLPEDLKQPMYITVSNITAKTVIAVVFEGDTYSVTATAGENGSISPSGIINANFGTSVFFTMTPDDGYKVSEIWVNGKYSGNGNTYNFTTNVLSSENTVEVIFERQTYTPSWTIQGSGSIVMNGSSPIRHGESREFTISPDEHYHFTNAYLTIGGDHYNPIAGDNNDIYSFTDNGGDYTLILKNVTGNVLINLIISIDTYDVSITPGSNGKIVLNSEIIITSEQIIKAPYNSTIVLTVQPNQGYHISSIVKNKTPLTEFDKASHSFSIVSITADQTVMTTYEINKYNINFNITGGGSILYNGSGVNRIVADYGQTPTIKLEPSAGYNAYKMIINLSEVTIPASLEYTFSAVTYDIQVDVTYSVKIFNIMSEQKEGGHISWPESFESVKFGQYDYLKVSYNNTVIYTFTPDDYYHIDTLMVKLNNETFISITNGYDDSFWNYTVTNGIGKLIAKNVKESREISISYAKNTYTITASVSGRGTISPSGSNIREYNDNITFTYVPDNGYQIINVLIDGEAVSLSLYETSYSFGNIAADHTIEVIFAPI